MDLTDLCHYCAFIAQNLSSGIADTQNVYAGSFDHSGSSDRGYANVADGGPSRVEGNKAKALINQKDLDEAIQWHRMFHQALENGLTPEMKPREVYRAPTTRRSRGLMTLTKCDLSDEALVSLAREMECLRPALRYPRKILFYLFNRI